MRTMNSRVKCKKFRIERIKKTSRKDRNFKEKSDKKCRESNKSAKLTMKSVFTG